MESLQAILIFLVVFLSVLLAIAGIQIFLILKDLKKVLSKLNKLLQAEDKPHKPARRPEPKRFYKKIL